MKKKVMSLFLVAAMAATMLAGCGNEDSGSAGGSGSTGGSQASGDAVANLIANTQGTVDLTLWCSETDAYQTIMKEIVANFEAAYPDVNFNITIGNVSESQAKDEVLKDVEAAADVFVFADDQLLELVNAGALQSVATTFTYDPKTANAASTVEAASVNGQLYAYPLTASNGYFLFYDSNALSEADVASWDALLAACEAQGKTVGMDADNSWYMYGFFAGAGLEMYRNDDGSNTCNWNATDTKYAGVDVAEAIVNIYSSPAFVNADEALMYSSAADGTMIAAVNGTWSVTDLSNAWGDGYAATKLPTFTVNGDQVQMSSFAGYKFVGVNSYSDNTGWAMLLAEFITNQESQEAIGIATGEGPSNLVAAASEQIASAPALAALAEQAQYANLQRVGDNFWSPADSLGAALLEGSYTDLQSLLDEAVAGITQ